MTWNELADAIAIMPEDELNKTVIYREPYDSDTEHYMVDVVSATENLVGTDGCLEIPKGDLFLQ